MKKALHRHCLALADRILTLRGEQMRDVTVYGESIKSTVFYCGTELHITILQLWYTIVVFILRGA